MGSRAGARRVNIGLNVAKLESNQGPCNVYECGDHYPPETPFDKSFLYSTSWNEGLGFRASSWRLG